LLGIFLFLLIFCFLRNFFAFCFLALCCLLSFLLFLLHVETRLILLCRLHTHNTLIIFPSSFFFSSSLMRGLVLAVASLAPAYAHNDIHNTFDILTLSVSNSIGYLFDIPKNMGEIETFFTGKKTNAPLSTPIIASASSDMAASGSATQQTLWGSVAVEGVISYIAFEDTGACQLYDSHMMEYRDNDPASCPATTSTIPSESTGAAQELARPSNCLVDWHLDATGVKTTSFVNRDFDPRARGWYIATKDRQVPNWSSV
jgi:hypothetical protein